MTAISAGVYPRLAYIGFTFAQPFLVQRVLDFIDQPVGPNTNNYAYGLVGAYALVYIGIAVRQHLLLGPDCLEYQLTSPRSAGFIRLV